MTRALSRFDDVAQGLALEAELFARSEPAVGVWTARTRALVCPQAFRRQASFDDAAAKSERRGWPVVTRGTGGGVVPQGSGLINLALAFDPEPGFTIEGSYRLLTDSIRLAFGHNGHRLKAGVTPHSFCDGAWNLSINGRKVVGTAQRWRPAGNAPARVLAHALILARGDIAPAARAVDLFHRDLGLPTVRAAAHTTIEAAFGRSMADPETLAKTLHETATQTLTGIRQAA